MPIDNPKKLNYYAPKVSEPFPIGGSKRIAKVRSFFMPKSRKVERATNTIPSGNTSTLNLLEGSEPLGTSVRTGQFQKPNRSSQND